MTESDIYNAAYAALIEMINVVWGTASLWQPANRSLVWRKMVSRAEDCIRRPL
jgi:hypothetical protein